MWVVNQTKARVWEDSSLFPEISTKNAVQEFRLWIRMRIAVKRWIRYSTALVANAASHLS